MISCLQIQPQLFATYSITTSVREPKNWFYKFGNLSLRNGVELGFSNEVA